MSKSFKMPKSKKVLEKRERDDQLLKEPEQEEIAVASTQPLIDDDESDDDIVPREDFMDLGDDLKEDELPEALEPFRPIGFYKPQGPLGCLSNFSPHSVTRDGFVYPTAAHYFYSVRLGLDHPDFEKVRCSATPQDAMNLSRGAVMRRQQGEDDGVMFDGLLTKFSQHRKIRDVLLGTGEAILVNQCKKDTYWGDGGDGTGRNMLGFTLMAVRDEIRRNGLWKEAPPDPEPLPLLVPLGTGKKKRKIMVPEVPKKQ